MQANISRGTGPETLLRSALAQKGLRIRRHCRPEPTIRCEADFVFVGKKLCVFVDGCFWHGCPKHFRLPKTNTRWWAEKINGNINRDKARSRILRAKGWKVLRVWEHQLHGTAMARVVARICKLAAVSTTL